MKINNIQQLLTKANLTKDFRNNLIEIFLQQKEAPITPYQIVSYLNYKNKKRERISTSILNYIVEDLMVHMEENPQHTQKAIIEKITSNSAEDSLQLLANRGIFLTFNDLYALLKRTTEDITEVIADNYVFSLSDYARLNEETLQDISQEFDYFLNLRELRELCLLAYNKGIKDNSLLDILNDKDNVENIIKYIGKGDK